MDSDLKYIIDEENKLIQLLDDCKKSALKRVEEHRISTIALKNSEFERIESEYSRMTEIKLQEIKKEIADELETLQSEQARLLDDVRLRNKITGRIVSVILENRA